MTMPAWLPSITSVTSGIVVKLTTTSKLEEEILLITLKGGCDSIFQLTINNCYSTIRKLLRE